MLLTGVVYLELVFVELYNIRYAVIYDWMIKAKISCSEEYLPLMIRCKPGLGER